MHSTYGYPVVCDGPDTSAANTLTFLHFVEFIWHFRLELGKLVPHDSICEVFCCDMCASSFSKMYVYVTEHITQLKGWLHGLDKGILCT